MFAFVFYFKGSVVAGGLVGVFKYAGADLDPSIFHHLFDHFVYIFPALALNSEVSTNDLECSFRIRRRQAAYKRP